MVLSPEIKNFKCLLMEYSIANVVPNERNSEEYESIYFY